MDTVFRVATAGDEAAIRRLFVEMLRTIFHTQEVEGYPAGYVGRFFTGGEDEILVAEQAGAVVGFLSLESHREGEPPFLYLDDFSVAAACRGQGIGSRLPKAKKIPVFMKEDLLGIFDENEFIQELPKSFLGENL